MSFDKLETTVSVDASAIANEIEQLQAQVQELAAENAALHKTIEELEARGFGGLPAELIGEIEEERRKLAESRRRFDFPEREIGGEPRGDWHGAGGWGIHFKISDRLEPLSDPQSGFNGVAHIGKATVESRDGGTMRAALGKYDGENDLDLLVEREIDLDPGVNRIDLDMEIPESGEYLLQRRGGHVLKRWEYPAYVGEEGAVQNGLKLIGGSKPGDWDKPNEFWYFFGELQLASAPGRHVEV